MTEKNRTWKERLVVIDDAVGSTPLRVIAAQIAQSPALTRDPDFMGPVLGTFVPLAETEVEQTRGWNEHTSDEDRPDGPLNDLTYMLTDWLHTAICWDRIVEFAPAFLATARDADAIAVSVGGCGRLEAQAKGLFISYGDTYRVEDPEDRALIGSFGEYPGVSPLVRSAIDGLCDPGEALVDGFGLAMAIRRFVEDRANAE